MKFKKLCMITLLLLFILMIGSVGAADDSVDMVGIDESNDQIIQSDLDSDTGVCEESYSDDPILTDVSDEDSQLEENLAVEDNDNDVLADVSADEGDALAENSNTDDNGLVGATSISFKNLQTILSTGADAELPYDVVYDPSTDGDIVRTGGIKVQRNFILHGNGKTIDAKGNMCIFIVMNCRFTIENVNFINGKGYNDIVGGAILSQNSSLTLKNCNFSSNTENVVAGGAVYATSSNITITGSTFHNNKANNSGGVIYTARSNINIAGSTFYNNKATSGGGVIYAIDGSTLTIHNSTFYNNTAGSTGGVVYANNYSSLVVNNSTFYNNSVNSSGGVVYVYYVSSSTVNGSTFYNNSVNSSGGVVYVYTGSIFTVNKSSFYNNSAKSYGTAVFVYNTPSLSVHDSTFSDNKGGTVASLCVVGSSDIIVNKSTFNGNKVSNHGGAIYVEDGNSLKVINSSFMNNGAESYGGAIDSAAKSLTISDSNFTGNKANSDSSFGGAVYAHDSSSLTITNSNFTSNTVNSNGAGVYSRNVSSITIVKATFKGNAATNTGSAIFATGASSFTINDSVFNNNKVGWAGAICVYEDSNLNVFNTSFKNNSANNGGGLGGAIYVYQGSGLTVRESNFTDNKATSSGGAIYAGSPSGLSVTGSTFSDNSANYGGAIYAYGSAMTFSGSKFNNNTADTDGGAIYASDSSGLNVTGSNFNGNKANRYASAIFIDNVVNSLVKESAFNKNIGDVIGSVCAVGNTNLNVIKSNFTNNTVSNGGGAAIYATNGANLNVSESTFTGNIASAAGGAIYAIKASALNVFNSTFNKNKADLGGAIYVENSSVSLNRTNFNDNLAEETDGAVHAVDCPSLNVLNSTFRNNTGNLLDYAFYSEIGEIRNSTFIDSKIRGGVTVASDCKVLTGSLFTIASISNTYQGGPINISVSEAHKFNGTVTVKIGSNSYNINLVNGIGSQIVTNLSPGNYKAILDFTESYNFTSFYTESNVFSIKPRSFIDLANMISNAAPGTTINLDYDFDFIPDYDSSLVNGIVINKSITINGNNHTLDMKSLARMFNITDGVDVTIKNLNFNNGNVTGMGGAIYASNNKLTIIDSAFNNNYVVGNGGAIYALNVNNLTILHTTFNYNHAYNSIGAAIYLNNTRSNINDSVFFMNSPMAICVYDGSKLTLFNSSFNNNSGYSGGAVYICTNSSADIFNSTFNGNTASSGGTFTVYGNSSLSIYNSNVTNSSSAYDGDAIDSRDNNLTIVNCIFANNKASQSGVAISATKGEIRNSTFIESTIFGGISISDDCNIYFTPSFQFEMPILDCVDGSPIHIWIRERHRFTGTMVLKIADESFDLVFVNGTCNQDFAYNLPNGKYKAILNFTGNQSIGPCYLESNNFSVRYSSFYDLYNEIRNSYYDILTLEKDYTFNENFDYDQEYYSYNIVNGIPIRYDIIINGNGHTVDAKGLARIFNISEGAKVTIENITLINGKAEDGGAIHVSDNANLTLVNCKFENNTARGLGGSIYAAAYLNVSGSTFVNGAAQTGSGVYASPGRISNSTFIDCNLAGDIPFSDDVRFLTTPHFEIANIPDFAKGASININVSESHRFNGLVTVTIGTEAFNINLENGRGSDIVIPNLNPGTYKAILNFTGDESFASYYAESNEFTIRAPTFVDLYEIINDAGSDAISLFADYSFNGDYDSDLVNGIPITKDIVINGNGHVIDANGLARIFNISNGAKVTIENITLINGNAEDGGAVYASDDSSLTVVDSTFGNNTASGTGGAIYSEGVLNVSGSTFERNGDANGSGVYANEGLISNTTFIGGAVSGNIPVSDDCIMKYAPMFEIADITDIIVGSPITISVSESHGLTGTVTISIGTLNFTLDLSKGVGSKSVTLNLAPGTYNAILSFGGNERFGSGTAVSNEFAVKPKVATSITASPVTATYNVNKYLVITLRDRAGKALSGVKVTVSLGSAKTYTTDKNGQVKINVATLLPKTYTAKISFAGNANYLASSKSVKVTVKKAKAKLTAKKKTFKRKVKVKKYSVVLKTNKNKAMKKVKLTLKVKGKTYKAKTNKKGKAVFKIKNLKKKGKFNAVIKFAGNKHYSKLTKKVRITVKK